MNENRIALPFDAVLHLLDRQLLDPDGRMLGKVDDLELAQEDGSYAITGIFTGTTALLHRLGGRIGNQLVESHARLRPHEPDRDRPWRLPIEWVDHVDSAVHIDRDREGVLLHDRELLRFGTLTGMGVREADGTSLGRVIDARFRPGARPVLDALVVGRGGPGSYLGYERNRDQGPAIVGDLVRWWHRHTRTIDIGQVDIDWDGRTVTVR